MIYRLHMRRRSKNINNLESRYPINKELLEKRLRHLYKVGLRHLKLLLLPQLSLSFQPLNHLYDVNSAVVGVVLQGIK
jgi:hypothetical protein